LCPRIDLGEFTVHPGDSPLAPVSATQTRVLIADEESAAGSLAVLLRRLGYWLTKTAFCGANALELAQDFRPSIIFIALNLPDMSAAYVARRLRERARAAQRLIALASDQSLASRDRARESGLPRCLTKPVGLAALQHALRTNLS
jgi:DNA-binding response OmpR family regulator